MVSSAGIQMLRAGSLRTTPVLCVNSDSSSAATNSPATTSIAVRRRNMIHPLPPDCRGVRVRGALMQVKPDEKVRRASRCYRVAFGAPEG